MEEAKGKAKWDEKGLEEAKGKAKWDEEELEEAEAKVKIWNYAFGCVEIYVIRCAIELGIADAIQKHGRPMTLSELSSVLDCTPSYLHRLMRFLLHRKIFKMISTIDEGVMAYDQTALSRRLLKNGEQSMAGLIMLESSPVMLAPWLALSGRVLSNGTPSFEKANGKDVWSYAADHADHSQLIDEAMACDARVSVPAVAEGFPEAFEGIGTLVDVGGGNGTSLRLLVKAFTSIRGINFDLPHVVSAAQQCDGVENVGGDMFVRVPQADAAFIMWVLHDWSDEECIAILRNCREAIPKEKGKVIIVEAVVEEKNADVLEDVRLMLDMVMMAHTNSGKERTLKEWAYVIEKAGFSRFTVTPIHAVQSVIIAFP